MKDDGGPAFPDPAPREDGAPGMSLRQWYAGMALQGMLAGSQGLKITVEEFAAQSHALADAMLAEGKKEQP